MSLTTAFLIFTIVACFVSMVLAILEEMDLAERLEDTERELRAMKRKHSHDILVVPPWVSRGQHERAGWSRAR